MSEALLNMSEALTLSFVTRQNKEYSRQYFDHLRLLYHPSSLHFFLNFCCI